MNKIDAIDLINIEIDKLNQQIDLINKDILKLRKSKEILLDRNHINEYSEITEEELINAWRSIND